jgi:hypothetical protein
MFTTAAVFFLLIFLFIAVTSLFWLWMLSDAIRQPQLDPVAKGIWVAVIFFGHFLGAIVYYFAGRNTLRRW